MIEMSRDVTFEEDVAFRRSKGTQMEIDHEESPQDMEIDHTPEIQREAPQPKEDDDPVEPLEPTDGPIDIVIGRKRPL